MILRRDLNDWKEQGEYGKIYDIIIWGASGFTGRLAVDYIYKESK